MNINTRESIPDDVCGIRQVTKITWIDTYPNEQLNISRADIENKFKDDDTPLGKKKIEERRADYYHKPNIQIYVATYNEKIIGFCSCSKKEKYNRIQAIYVLPNYQGYGAGRKLITKAFSWFGKEKNIKINVASYNKNSIGFYKHMGFAKTNKKEVFDEAAKLPSGKIIPEIELELFF